MYLDVIVVFGKSFDETLERFEAVLKRLGKFGLKLKPSKCKLFLNEIPFLGHIVSDKGVAPDPSKVRSVTDWLSNPPSSTSELQTFLGFVGYYRSFIRNFSAIAQPLYQLLGGRTGNKKTLPQWRWTYDCQKTFELLISKLTQPPILAYPDFTKPFILHIDASGSGLGAALYQTQDGKQRVIAYGS